MSIHGRPARRECAKRYAVLALLAGLALLAVLGTYSLMWPHSSLGNELHAGPAGGSAAATGTLRPGSPSPEGHAAGLVQPPGHGDQPADRPPAPAVSPAEARPYPAQPWPLPLDPQPAPFTIAVTSDMREFAGPGFYDTSQYFRGAAETIAALGGTAFMVVPGDLDPTTGVAWTITATLGPTYTWYPVVGNHELPGQGMEAYWGANMDWLRAYDYGAANPGPPGCPETTYSFDYGDAHLVVLNEYCDVAGDTATDGNVPDHLYDWLADDLKSTRQEHILVVGHEPAYPWPDADNGRLRHEWDSLNQYPAERDRFWALLRRHGVVYVCGHTHNYSAVLVAGVWQIDTGHARGAGDPGAASTVVLLHVGGAAVTYDTYRAFEAGGAYTLAHRGTLDRPVAGLAAANDGPTLLARPTALTATVSAGTNVTYSWSLGDGSFVVGPSSFAHTYAVAGRYTVVVTAGNSANLLTATTVVSVYCGGPPVIGFTWDPLTPTAGLTVTFHTIAAGMLPQQVVWSFGDGAWGSGMAPTHRYQEAGRYTAAMTATDACGTVVVTHALSVIRVPPVPGSGVDRLTFRTLRL